MQHDSQMRPAAERAVAGAEGAAAGPRAEAQEPPPDCLAGGGATGAMMRALDWSATPLGPASLWPQSLRTTVSTCLNCSFPILIWWGPELVKLYNDAYATIIGVKHPAALGSPGKQVWPEIWDTIGPMLARVMECGEAVPANDLRLVLHRHGYPEECYFSFSYSPIRDEFGGVGGVFCPVIETTTRVFAERRAAFLLDLEARLRDLQAPLDIKHAASTMLAAHLGGNQVGYAEAVSGGAKVFIDGDYDDGVLRTTRGVHRLAEYGPAMEAQLRRGETVQIDDVRQDPRTSAAWPAYEKFGINALLNVPLIKAGQLKSILFVHSAAARAWSANQVALVQDVAERTWSAVERATAEAALRRSEEEFRALGENLPNLCWMAKPDGWIYWYNRHWYDYTGTTPEQMLGWGWQGVHDPVLLPEINRRWNEALAGGSAFEMIFPLRGADGVFRPFLTRINPVRDTTGAITRWFGSNVDISAQHAAEARLRDSATQLLRLNETLEQQVAARTADRDRLWRLSTDIMMVARLDGTIIAANPAWTTMLGWQQADLLGHSFFAFVHPADVAATQGAMASLSEGRTVFQFQNRYRSRDGSYRWLAWSSVPDAGLIHAVGRDVTAEKEAALQLEATQERLRQAQRMEALGQLAGGIAHDFNNVLQSVTGGLTLIAKRAEDPASVRKLATMAGEAAARGASITGRLLSFARQGALQSVPVDPVALLEGLAEMLTHTLGPNIAVRTEAEAALPAFLADKAQLETALVNLAVNARDAMPEGGVLTISARAETVPEADPTGRPTGSYIRITVTDTGRGMDAATLARAGEPFFTTKPLGRGTGLGLAMARGFIEQSGGTIDIVSAPGEGTAVTLWLPQAPAASAPAPATAVALDPALLAVTVLLVDDDTRVRLTLAEHLADVGYRVVQASDGLDAVTRLDSGQPIDLLITDFAMPGMNGLALIQEVRRRLPDLPVVLLTGFADVGVRDRLVHDPADGMVLLQKPIAPDDLAARAASLLKQWQQAAD